MRSLESRILKLESRTRHEGEMLLIWCAEDENAEGAVERARPLFTADDRVAIAQWYGNNVPAPRWHKDFPMKALDIDSSLSAREELAKELGYTGDMGESATMNIWLHKQVMAKVAANGGIVPSDLKH